MKKRIICMAVTVLLIGMCAVGCSSVPAKPADTGSEPQATEAFTGDSYLLAELPGHYRVPDGYHVYAKDSGYTESMCQAQGFRKDQMDMYLSMSDVSAMIVPADQKYASAEAVFTIKTGSDLEDYPEDFNELSDDELTELADVYATGVKLGLGTNLSGDTESGFVRHNGMVLFRVSFHVRTEGLSRQAVQMVRFFGNKTVVFAVDSDSEIDQKYMDDLESIAFSLRKD